MVSLSPPFRSVDGFIILPDHADPHLWHVLPSVPRLAYSRDGVPEFSLVQYLGGGAGAEKIAGGLCSITFELPFDPATLARVKEIAGTGTALPSRVVPVRFESGTVELIAFGKRGESAGAEGLSVTVFGSGKPSLDDMNRATFQLMLDANAAELLEKSIESDSVPIIALYRMRFAGLRPSFSLSIKADWSEVYRSLQHKAAANLYYVAADVDMMVENALKEQNVDIDSAVFGTAEGERVAAERARKQLLDWALEKFFEPVIQPDKAAAVGSAVESTVWSVVRSLVPGITYRFRQLTRTQTAALAIRMNESVAEVREVVPQGILGNMFRPFHYTNTGDERPEWAQLRTRLISQVNLDGFPRLEIVVAAENRFSSDGIRQITVELSRTTAEGDLTDRETILLRSAEEQKIYMVNLLGEKTDFTNLYRYRMEVDFDPASSFGPRESLQSEWIVASAPQLFVEPRDLYWIREIKPVAAPTFPFSLFPAVTVELRVPQTSRVERVTLTADAQPAVWRFRAVGDAVPAYEYRLSYHRSTGSDTVVTDWRTQIDEWLSIEDPMPRKRRCNLFFNLPWDQMTTGFLQLRYNDQAHDIHYEEQITVSRDIPFVAKEYAIAEDGPLNLQYRLTVLFATGALLEGSWNETTDDRIVIDRRSIDLRRVSAEPIGGSLSENSLREVRLLLEVAANPESEAGQSTTLTFSGADQNAQSWSYMPSGASLRLLRYSGIFIDTNGFIIRQPKKMTPSEIVIVDLKRKRFLAQEL